MGFFNASGNQGRSRDILGGLFGPSSAQFRNSVIGRLSGQRLNPRARSFLRTSTERIDAGRDVTPRSIEGFSGFGVPGVGATSRPFSSLGRSSELQSQFQSEDLTRALANQGTLLALRRRTTLV